MVQVTDETPSELGLALVDMIASRQRSLSLRYSVYWRRRGRVYGDAMLDTVDWDYALIDREDTVPVTGQLQAFEFNPLREPGSLTVGRVITRGGKWYLSSMSGMYMRKDSDGWFGRVLALMQHSTAARAVWVLQGTPANVSAWKEGSPWAATDVAS